VKILRSGFDWFTGYKHSPGAHPSHISSDFTLELAKGEKAITEKNTPKSRQMTEKDWLLRILFLETVAGVPGMVGGMLRHLKSLRKLEKEGRWIETLLEEAENERMHLMTFMAIKKPAFWMRMMIVGAQGVFCNAFFFAYLLYTFPSQNPSDLIL
jgi:ubiquinol oxidase